MSLNSQSIQSGTPKIHYCSSMF